MLPLEKISERRQNMRITTKLLALLLTVILLVGSIPMGVFAASVEENEMTDEAKSIYTVSRTN